MFEWIENEMTVIQRDSSIDRYGQEETVKHHLLDFRRPMRTIAPEYMQKRVQLND